MTVIMMHVCFAVLWIAAGGIKDKELVVFMGADVRESAVKVQ